MASRSPARPGHSLAALCIVTALTAAAWADTPAGATGALLPPGGPLTFGVGDLPGAAGLGVGAASHAPTADVSGAAILARQERHQLSLDAPVLLASDIAAAAPGGDAPSANGDSIDLAKKLANPLASMISVPFQYNATFNAGVSGRAHRSTLNIQPVIPFELNSEWNLISRTIIPVIYQEELGPGQNDNWGLGDITASFFFSPKEPANGWIWGVGPVAYLPTATDTALGAGKWGAGITGVALKQENGWTVGLLANHVWSFCGDSDRPSINSTFAQPFVAYTWPTATTLTLNTEASYDWTTSQWTAPVNLLVSQVLKVGGLPVQFQCGPQYYVEGPSLAPEWGLRFAVTFLFPSK